MCSHWLDGVLLCKSIFSHTYIIIQTNSLSVCFILCLCSVIFSGNVDVFWVYSVLPWPTSASLLNSLLSVEAEFISNASLVVVRSWTNKRLAGEAYLSGCTHTTTHMHTHANTIQKHTINSERQICLYKHKTHVSTHVNRDKNTPFLHKQHINKGTFIKVQTRSPW